MTLGGQLRHFGHLAVDSLDPGRVYYNPGCQVVYATQRPLYSYSPHEPPLKAVPDLAERPPEISHDRHSVTVRIRQGVRFSPPVNRLVSSADVKYALQRLFSANVGGRYLQYYKGLRGAPSGPGRYREIPGIETPDDRTLVFHLKDPSPHIFVAALALPATAPVPEELARPLDQHRPSLYEHHVACTGPYMVRTDGGGKVTEYVPGVRLELIRNPNWLRETDYKPAYLDRISLEGTDNTRELAEQVLAGSHVVLAENPVPEIARAVAGKEPRQYHQARGRSYRYIPLNTTIAPFSDVNVRRAVVAGFDREKVRDARGGAFIGPVASHFLPPGFPGHEEAGGLEGPALDFIRNPCGDRELAANYLKRAGYASGRYTGESITALVAQDGANRAQGDAVVEELQKLGFEVNKVVVPNNDVVPEYCQVPAREIDGRKIAVYGSPPNWVPDIGDPQGVLEPTFAGWAISARDNHNMSQLDDDAVNSAIRRASGLSGAERISAWAAVDEAVTTLAPGVPLVWEVTGMLTAPDVRGAINPQTHFFDLPFLEIV